MNIKEEKQKLRQQYLSLLKVSDTRDREAKSALIQEKVITHPTFKKIKGIMLYASTPFEVHTEKIIEEAFQRGKKVILPSVDTSMHELVPCWVRDLKSDLVRGTYGLLEPRHERWHNCELSDIEWVIVPGVAFDRSGHRLGRGAGYYDRFLSQIHKRIPTAGLAFDFQIVDTLPTEDHDVVLNEVITN